MRSQKPRYGYRCLWAVLTKQVPHHLGSGARPVFSWQKFHYQSFDRVGLRANSRICLGVYDVFSLYSCSMICLYLHSIKGLKTDTRGSPQ